MKGVIVNFHSVDTTWTAADSPYEMIASVIVDEGVTLTIEPDVIVKVAGQYALQIKGGLVARGTETEPIIFTAKSSTMPGSWGYIKFEDSSMDAISILQYCTVEYGGGSGNGAVWGDSASPFIDNCVIRQNAASGLYLDSSASIISNNTISDNTGNGIYTSSSGTVTISDNTISGNTISGSNGAAVYTKSSKPFTNNIIANNEAEGSGNTNAVFINATPAFNYNSITDNTAEFALYYNKPAGSPDLDATDNWWGTTVDMEIFLMIYDFFDDASKGIVNYRPYLRTLSPPEDLTITVADSIVTLNWTANPESDLAGYKVYYGQNEGGPYDGTGAVEGDSPIDVGDVTTATPYASS